jgi:hypothetical protein
MNKENTGNNENFCLLRYEAIGPGQNLPVFRSNVSLQSSRSRSRFEVFKAVIMMNVVFWDLNPSSYFTVDTLRLRYRVQRVNAM